MEDHIVFLGDQKGGGKDQSPPKEFRGEGTLKKSTAKRGGGGKDHNNIMESS